MKVQNSGTEVSEGNTKARNDGTEVSEEKTKVQDNKIEIRTLEKEENLILRPLWEEVFCEDSKEFTDYYFKEKAVRNHGLALYGEEGARAMLYLSPYQMQLRVGNDWEYRELNYIVGVATKEKYRHRGYMDRLLKEAFRQMHESRQPFAFLMPANPKIYEPYQFAYIYDRQEYEMLQPEVTVAEYMSETEIPSLQEFAVNRLAECYDVFIRRDETYYEVLMKELKAQNGGIYIKKKQDKITGYFLYTKEERGEIQEAVLTDEEELPFKKKADKTPIIMARIVDVREMLAMLRTKEGTAEVVLSVNDPILQGNSGIWKCTWSAGGAQIQKVQAAQIRSGQQQQKVQAAQIKSGQQLQQLQAAQTKNGQQNMQELYAAQGKEQLPKTALETALEGARESAWESSDRILAVNIEDLTAWVFGYKSAKECFRVWDGENVNSVARKIEGTPVLEKLATVKTLSRVFINEIV